MKKFKNDVTKEIEELRANVAYQEGVLAEARYNIEEREKFLAPIVLKEEELREALRNLMLAVMARESALRNHDRESVDISGALEAARVALEGKT
jgi:hypothetical protein